MRYLSVLTILIFLLSGCENDEGYMEGRVTTLKTTEISSRSAVLTGKVKIVTEGKEVNPNIVARGFWWGEAPDKLEHRITGSGRGEGSFSCNLGNLNPDTRYYVKAYVTIEYSGNSSYDTNAIAFYGNIIEFMTGH